MYRRCLVCGAPFPENELLPTMPTGKRIAFDPHRGRIWLICGRCRRWALVPIEERWEVLEELERHVRDDGRRLAATAHVTLLQAGPLELLRVGTNDLAEESWWRFGREMLRRRDRAAAVSTVGALGVGALAVGGWAAGGVAFLGAWVAWNNREWAGERLGDLARWARLGSTAWKGERSCPVCDRPLRALPFRQGEGVALGTAPGAPGTLELHLPCTGCRDGAGGLVLSGPEGERALARLLAHRNHGGASEGVVDAATDLVRRSGSGHATLRELATGRPTLGAMSGTLTVALEVATAAEQERRLLEMEVAELEAHWRMEEELAAIIDGELTPLPLPFRRTPSPG